METDDLGVPVDDKGGERNTRSSKSAAAKAKRFRLQTPKKKSESKPTAQLFAEVLTESQRWLSAARGLESDLRKPRPILKSVAAENSYVKTATTMTTSLSLLW